MYSFCSVDQCVFFVVSMCFFYAANGNVNDDWVDPKDMLRYNSMSQTMLKAKRYVNDRTMDNDAAKHYFSSGCNPLVNPCANVERCCPPCPSKSPLIRATGKDDRSETNRCRESLFVARYVNRLLHLFNDVMGESTPSFKVDVTLTRQDLEVFKRYVTSKGSIQDVEEILSRMITNVERRSWIKEMKEAIVFQEWISFLQKNILYIIIFVGILIMVRSMLKNRWYTSVFQLLTILYVISIIWELQHQFLKADAKKQMSRQQFSQIPKECNPEMLSYWEYFLSSVNNRCQEYYEAQIDSHWEVNPFMAAVAVFTRTLPLFGSGLGGGIGEFYKTFNSYFTSLQLFIMLPLATVILGVIIYYSCTAGLSTVIMAQPTRQMVEDVDANGQRQQLPQTLEVPVLEQHHHHYYLQGGSNEGAVALSCDEVPVCSSKRVRQIHCTSSRVEDLESSNETTEQCSEIKECSQSERECGEQLQNVGDSEDKIKSE